MSASKLQEEFNQVLEWFDLIYRLAAAFRLKGSLGDEFDGTQALDLSWYGQNGLKIKKTRGVPMTFLSCRSVKPHTTALAGAILVLATMAGMGRTVAATPEAAVITPDASRQAYSATFTQSSAGSLSASFGTVPNGKRLVIESESVLCSINTGYPILYAYMYTNFGRTYLLLQKMGSANGFDYYEGTFTNTMYGDPTGLGTGDITFFLQSSASYNGTPVLHCTGGIVGHNVAAPRH